MKISHLTNLFEAIFNCFLIIIFGYGAGRLNIISSTQGQGIGNFVGTFALPAMLFKAMVELNFSTVNWAFMCSMLLAKSTVFMIVLTLTILVLGKKGIGRAALYAIFSTQSNDFALGYPIVKVLYEKTYPELLQYIYLIAPISMLILNPIGFVLLEIDKHWKNEKQKQDCMPTIGTPCDTCPLNDTCPITNHSQTAKKGRYSSLKTVLNVTKGLVLNPIVLMVFIGLIFHFILNGKLPSLMDQVLTTLSNAFSAAALFYLGLSMVGKLGNIRGVSLLLPASLIVAKILLLPILARESMFIFARVLPIVDPHAAAHNVTALGHASAALLGNRSVTSTAALSNNVTYLKTLADFSFLYGTFPTAPTVVIYAAKFGLETDRLASGMVICTTLSAPIMYVSAWTLTITSMRVSYYKKQVLLADQDISIVGLLCSLWCLCVFVITKKFQRVPHLITMVMTFTMFIGATMTIISDVILQAPTRPDSIGSTVSFAFLYFGVTATRLYTATLALCVAMVKYVGERHTWSYRWLLIGVPAIIACILTAVVLSTGRGTDVSPVFRHGRVQDVTSFSCLLVSFLVTSVTLVVVFRLPNLFEKHKPPTPPRRNGSLARESDELSELSPEHDQLLSLDEQLLDDRTFSSSDQSSPETDELKWWQFHNGSPEITRHVVLLLLQSVSLFIGLVLTGWRVNGHSESGVYFEIAFLDSVFNFGQAFFVFVIFGIDAELIIDPFIRAWRKAIKGYEDISQPPLDSVDKNVLRKCFVFVKYHLPNCKRDVLRNRRRGLRTFKSVTTGCDLCSWLVDVGLAADRREALIYGQDLMLGRVIRHVSNKHYFHDKKYLYRFEDYSSDNTGNWSSISTTPSEFGSRSDSTFDLGQPSGTNGAGSTVTCPLQQGFSFLEHLSAADLRSTTVASPAPRRRIRHVRHETDGDLFDDEPLSEETNLGSELDPESPVHAGPQQPSHKDLNDW